MRIAALSCMLIALGAVSAAQETNFPVGPQYLMNFGSPLMAQPIATPSLSLEAPLPGIPSLPKIGPAVENEAYVANPELRHQADLFPVYYGYPRISAVEISSAEAPLELPTSITDVGVIGMTDAQSLRLRGFGVPLGDNATFWKAHKPHARRVYTNEDLQHLRPN